MRLLIIALVFTTLGLFILSMTATHLLKSSHEFISTAGYGYCSKCHPQESDDVEGHAGLVDCIFCHEGGSTLIENSHAIVKRGCEDCHSAEGVSMGLSTTNALSELSSYQAAHGGMLDQHDITTACIACHCETPARIVDTASPEGIYYVKSHKITRDFQSIKYMGDWNADFCKKCHLEIVEQLEVVKGNQFHGRASCGGPCHGYSGSDTSYHVVERSNPKCGDCHSHHCPDNNQSAYPCCVTHDIQGCDEILCTPTGSNDCSTDDLRILDDTQPCCRE